MPRLTKIRANKKQRQIRTRRRLSPKLDRPRLSVFISLKYIYAQVIDDDKAVTLVSASSLKSKSKNLSQQAQEVGAELAEKCLKLKINQVVLDRGSKTYHGRLKILAQTAREKGLKM